MCIYNMIDIYSKACGRVGCELSPGDLTAKHLSLRYGLKNLKRRAKYLQTGWF